MAKIYNFHVHGMHCKSCSLLIENELGALPGVSKVKADHINYSLEITGDFGDKPAGDLAQELTNALMKHGYSLSLEKQIKDKNWSDFKLAIPIALAIIVLFIVLQKIGLVNLISVQDVSYGTAFLIGIIASLSSCMAVVGGLVLSMSATFVKKGDKIRPQLLFHGGRLLSFFFLGGIIGLIGSAFQFNNFVVSVLGFFVGTVMLILGVNLLDIFHWAKNIQPMMPKFLSRHAVGALKFNHTTVPFLAGVLTFFLPCGFTQSIQIYAFSVGSFWHGGLTMLAFALGTLPVLAAISFSSFTVMNSSKSGIFFKTAGIIVIIFALFNILNSLVAVGLMEPLFNF